MTPQGQVKVNIRRCQRCRGDHDKLVFHALTNPRDDYKWWAICPDSKEPLLLVSEQLVKEGREL